MTKPIVTIFSLIVVALLAGCVTAPEFADNSGKGCFRYGVAEQDNTGPMTHVNIADIPVVKLNYPDLLKACGIEPIPTSWQNRQYVQVRACFKPRPVDGEDGHDTIYLWRFYAGQRDLAHERCHALLGRKHNACYPHYGLGNSVETACPDWVNESHEFPAIYESRVTRQQ